MKKDNNLCFRVVEFDMEKGEAVLIEFPDERDASEMAIYLNRVSTDDNKVYLVEAVPAAM